MDISPFAASARLTIAAPPEALYDFIADMPAIGAISPQCTGGEWRGAERGVGALFVGSNTQGDNTWQAQMRVVVADRPRGFTWENLGAVDWPDARPLVRWGYTFESGTDGTTVEETWRILESYPALEALPESHRAGLAPWFRHSMEQTLGNLKARFEG
jgi:hypothetical protein